MIFVLCDLQNNSKNIFYNRQKTRYTTIPLLDWVFAFTLIQKPKQPQRNFILKTILDVVGCDKGIAHICYLFFPFFLSANFKGVFLVNAEIALRSDGYVVLVAQLVGKKTFRARCPCRRFAN